MRPHPETYAEALDIVEEGARLRLPLYDGTMGRRAQDHELDGMTAALETLCRFRDVEHGILAGLPMPPLKALVRFKGGLDADDPATAVSTGLVGSCDLARSCAAPPDGGDEAVRLHEEERLHRACAIVGHLVVAHGDAINAVDLGRSPTP